MGNKEAVMEKDKLILEQLLKEINNNGFLVTEFNELKCLKPKHKRIVSILTKYLYAFKADNYKDAIVEVLGVKGFTEATEILLKAYYDIKWNGDKWPIGNALYNIQDNRFEAEYIEIIANKDNGISRQMIIVLVGKLQCENAIPVLIELLGDEDVFGHAIMALGYYKKPYLINYIEPFLTHEKRWIRKEAEKSLIKIKS